MGPRTGRNKRRRRKGNDLRSLTDQCQCWPLVVEGACYGEQNLICTQWQDNPMLARVCQGQRHSGCQRCAFRLGVHAQNPTTIFALTRMLSAKDFLFFPSWEGAAGVLQRQSLQLQQRRLLDRQHLVSGAHMHAKQQAATRTHGPQPYLATVDTVTAVMMLRVMNAAQLKVVSPQTTHAPVLSR